MGNRDTGIRTPRPQPLLQIKTLMLAIMYPVAGSRPWRALIFRLARGIPWGWWENPVVANLPPLWLFYV